MSSFSISIDFSASLIIGVRSHEAKKIMKEKMKIGDKVRLSESGIGWGCLKESIKKQTDVRYYSIIAIPKNQVCAHHPIRRETEEEGVYALAEVVKEGYPDRTSPLPLRPMMQLIEQIQHGIRQSPHSLLHATTKTTQ